MALTQGARNKIKSFVQSAKRLLMNEFASQIQQYYGIRPDGSYIMVEELTSKDGSIIQTARLLRERLGYLEDTIAGTNKKEEAVEQLIREQAFTILNRFAALRMAEERHIIPETIKKGYNSEGFQVFDQLSGGAQTADQFNRYTWFLKAMFDELAIDLPAVFDRFSPYALLFPSEKVMLELLDIIDDEDLNIFREEGMQPLNLWEEDETIGWVYQYYNGREEISAMRDASGAPRNSRELAVRNQFFTPRYVVQFLVDNSLGRQWFEMTKGQTDLINTCEYLVKREQEIFLEKGEATPEAKIEGANYIEYRALKDPRDILMLDPACGSMHFGLYCFDLFEQIYLEAWDNHPELMPNLRDKYLREDYIKRIPGYILRYNIHGVDIDPRAIQIAGLSLWLRAQKSYKKLGLQPADRPMIKKSNLVVAEPMPGDAALLSEFTRSLPGPIGKLVRVIWDKMQLAGETGLLLKIEEELKKEVEIAKQEYKQYKGGSTQTSIFGKVEDSKVAEMAAIYGKEQKIAKDFFVTAEEEVLKALQNFAENAEGEHAFQKLLFADDTARGFAFIELCRKRYDVIVMNPPFGSTTVETKDFIVWNYPLTKDNLASVFIDRSYNLIDRNGQIGSISTRSIFYLKSFAKWRKAQLIENRGLNVFADFGLGVLDATVETCAYIIEKEGLPNASFIDLSKSDSKSIDLESALSLDQTNTYIIKLSDFNAIPNSPISYWIGKKTLKFFKNNSQFENDLRTARKGICTSDNFRYVRCYWEVNFAKLGIKREESLKNKYWMGFLQSDSSSRYIYNPFQVMNWQYDGIEVKAMQTQLHGNWSKRINSESSFFKPGLSWAPRTARFEAHIVPNGSMCTSGRILADFDGDMDEALTVCAYWNSYYADYTIKLSLEASSGNPFYNNGVVNKMPMPEFDEVFKKKLQLKTRALYNCSRSVLEIEPTSIFFINNDFLRFSSVDSYVSNLLSINSDQKRSYLKNQESVNEMIFEYLNLENEDKKRIIESVRRVSESEEGEYFNLNESKVRSNLFTLILGGVFGYFDLRMVKNWDILWYDNSLFKGRSHSPFLYGPRESTLDLVSPEYHDNIKEIWEMPNPIQILEECATVSDIHPITDKLKEVIKYFWPDSHDTIVEEFIEHFKVNGLDEIFDKHSKFFDAHLKDYSRNKRVSPIYWHLGVPSGNFTIWIYYPELNDSSLYKVINELVDPKIKEVKKDVDILEMNGSAKDYNDQKKFLAELENFKDELLSVAQLPYKPNQDDGVLITAAPMHNLFTHTKWRKSTADCWKKLEKGEYDWAHLAYSIWPDRVANKCKKDLSMAIAHGLESICEVKPKEKTTRKKPSIEEKNQQEML